MDYYIFKRMSLGRREQVRASSWVVGLLSSLLRWWNRPDPAGDREMRWYGNNRQ